MTNAIDQRKIANSFAIFIVDSMYICNLHSSLSFDTCSSLLDLEHCCLNVTSKAFIEKHEKKIIRAITTLCS